MMHGYGSMMMIVMPATALLPSMNFTRAPKEAPKQN